MITDTPGVHRSHGRYGPFPTHAPTLPSAHPAATRALLICWRLEGRTASAVTSPDAAAAKDRVRLYATVPPAPAPRVHTKVRSSRPPDTTTPWATDSTHTTTSVWPRTGFALYDTPIVANRRVSDVPVTSHTCNAKRRGLDGGRWWWGGAVVGVGPSRGRDGHLA